MSEMDRDLVTFVNDEGEEMEMEILDYFTHKGLEYAILADMCDCDDEDEAEECDCEDCEGHAHALYIMKVVVDGDNEEFLPVDPEMEDELLAVVEELFDEMEDEDSDE